MSYGREEVVAYLRYLADLPEGVRHRAWLFHAAHIITRDATTVYACSTCADATGYSEREGDPSQPLEAYGSTDTQRQHDRHPRGAQVDL
jgi:hypothetical protein